MLCHKCKYHKDIAPTFEYCTLRKCYLNYPEVDAYGCVGFEFGDGNNEEHKQHKEEPNAK